MTVAPPSSSQNILLSGNGPVARRSSLQEGCSSSAAVLSVTRARRSSLSSIGKGKTSSIVVMVKVDKGASSYDYEDTTTPTSNSEVFLQSADKRRRYMRRGSKTSFMLRGGASSFKVDLPPEWQTSLVKSMSSSLHDDCSSHSSSSLLSSSSPTRSPTQSDVSSSCSGKDLLSSSSRAMMAAKLLGSSSNSMPITFGAQRAAQLDVLRRANQELGITPPIFHPAGQGDRRQSTVSLLTSALELSCIEDQANMQL